MSREPQPTSPAAPHADSIGALIAAQARATPDAIAVSDGAVSVTYREFIGRASQLAHHLCGLGVRPETMVAIALDRSLDQLVAASAVMLAGGAYLPLDPSYPAQRLSFMLDDARAPVLITRAAAAGGFTSTNAARVLVDEDSSRIASQPTDPPQPVTAPSHMAYVIYTSGSTGRPKGAMNTVGGLLNRIDWMQRKYRLTGEDVVLQKTPLGFDVSVWECFWALTAGARIVVARPDGHYDPDYLADLIREHTVTVTHFVPSMLAVFLDTADLSRAIPCGR